MDKYENITVGNTVKIYRICQRKFNVRIFTEGNIVLNFLVKEGICTENAECNLRGDIKYLFVLKTLLKGDTVKRKAIFTSVLDESNY